MFNIRDIVNYKTFMNPHKNWGVIVEILNIEDSIDQETKGNRLYRINPLDTSSISYEFVEEKNITQAYSMYYEKKKEDNNIH